MKIRRLEIIPRPTIAWYIVTIFFILLSEWKGLLIWLAFSIFLIVVLFIVNKQLRDALFKKGG